MSLKKSHASTNVRQTKQLKAVGVSEKGMVAVESEDQGRISKSPNITGVAKKSFSGLVKQKKVIALALKKGEPISQIKGVKFVKPF